MSGEIKDVLIAGYGLMGRGIALTFARGGHSRDRAGALVPSRRGL